MNKTTFSSSVVSKEEYRDKKAWGLLASINLYGCNHEKITDKKLMPVFIKELCEKINMKPHGKPIIDKFGEDSLEGYSILQFIETSSITVHFDDKIGDRAFIDIFSCKYFNSGKAVKFCQKYFAAEKAKSWTLLRN